MSNLITIEKQLLESLLQMKGGYVLNFTDRMLSDFFRDDLRIDIYSPQYFYDSGSKANRLRGFWLKADDEVVGRSILKLVEYIEKQIIIGNLKQEDFPEEMLGRGKEIGNKLLGRKMEKEETVSQATFKNGHINITLQKEIFDHVQQLLDNRDYFHAVEEAYKVVRNKLEIITGKQRATDAFNESNYENIFGHLPSTDAEKDFFEGVKFLHMAIQFLRNEKAHTLAYSLDKNQAIHYIVLASLAYDLINKK